MDVSEVSKLAYMRGCVLQMTGCDGVLLYWVENAIFISKPFDRLEDLVELLLRLPILAPATLQKPETVYLPRFSIMPSLPIAA